MSDIETELKALRRDVERMKSKDKIVQQLTRYGRGQEWLDVTLMNEVFFEDAFVDFGFFTGIWRDYRPILMELELCRMLRHCRRPQQRRYRSLRRTLLSHV